MLNRHMLLSKNDILGLLRLSCLAFYCNLTASCGSLPSEDKADKENPPEPSPTNGTKVEKIAYTNVQPCDSTSTLSYYNFGESLFRTYCTSCHSSYLKGDQRSSAPEQLNFNTLELISLWKTDILRSVAGPNKSMPPAGHLTAEDIKDLETWLACIDR